MRKTDKDWILLGEKEPYWSVLTQPKYKPKNISPDVLDDFYSTGEEEIEWVVSRLRELYSTFEPEIALDFGCGVGRLTFPISKHASKVYGVDISPGMLSKAEERKKTQDFKNVKFLGKIPNKEFDWVNCNIVLQHITPKRGYIILNNILSKLSDTACISIQIIFWRDSIFSRLKIFDIQTAFFNLQARFAWNKPAPVGTMMVYDYDMNRVLKCLFDQGISDPVLVHTKHGDLHGCWVIGRKKLSR